MQINRSIKHYIFILEHNMETLLVPVAPERKRVEEVQSAKVNLYNRHHSSDFLVQEGYNEYSKNMHTFSANNKVPFVSAPIECERDMK